MATTIKIKNSVTATTTPTSLVQGEVAINVTDKKVWVGNAASSPVQIVGAGSGGGGAAGSNTQVQYNSSGALAGDADFTFNGTTVTMANDASISGLTVGKGGGAVATNTAVGLYTLGSNTSGANNVGVGQQALYLNTTGSQNTAIGWQAFPLNTTGSNNTALGYQSLQANTTASNNTAVGYQAGYSGTTSGNNTFVGKSAGYSNTAFDNTFVGFESGYSNTTGTNNAAIGLYSLLGNTTGSQNTGLGRDALKSNTTASNNTAVGYQAGYSNTTNGANVFLGGLSGYNSTGITNTYLGYGAGYSMTTGGKNVIIGGYNGNQGGLDIRTASNYIVLSDGDGNPRARWDSAGSMTTIASLTDGYSLVATNSQATRPYGIWSRFSGATPNNTTQSFLDCEDTTNLKCTIYSSGTVTNRTGTYNAFSDIKLKQDIVDAGSQWDDIKAVRVRKFRLKDEVAANPDTKPFIGVIAQELEQTSAGLIDDCYDRNGEMTKSVKYSILYMKAIKALQEAMERIETLEAKVTALENK